MAVIDAEYYCNVFGGAAADDRELESMIRRAEMLIETVIGRSVLGEFTSFQKASLQRAVAFEVEFLLMQDGMAGGCSSVSLGNYREVSSAAAKGGLIAPAAMACLMAAGLIYRGVGR